MIRRIPLLLLVASLALPALAQRDAHEVVSRWRDVVGAQRTPGTRTAILKSRSNEDGIEGKITETLTTAGAYRRVTTRKFDDSEVVVNATAAARRDWNGWIRHMQGRELERWRTAAFEQRVLLFGPPLALAKGEFSQSDDGRQYVLGFTTPGGVPMTWYIDAKTFLPAKTVKQGWDTEVTTEYSDWGDLRGVMTPKHAVVHETEKPDYEVTRKEVTIEQRARRFALPKAMPSDARLEPNAPPIPFTMEANHIVFSMSVNGREPLPFILDTGADQNIVSSTRAAELGVKPYAKSATTGGGNAAEYDYARDTSLTRAGVELRNQHVAVLDQTGLDRALGLPFGGILGYDFLSRFVVEIDYEKKLLTLHDPATWHYEGNGLIVPIVIDEGIPFAQATLIAGGQEIPARFVIDFGAAETMTLTSAFVKANDLVRIAQTSATVNRPAGLEKEFFAQNNVRGHIDELRLGGLRVESIPVNLSVNTGGAYASKQFAGTIGESIYSRYHTFLDYARNRVILEPTVQAGKPFPERQTYGLSLLASGAELHTYVAAAVRPGSPAEKDGFQKGDVITSLDGARSEKVLLSQLRDALAHAGEHHELGVRRGEKTLALAVDVRLVSLDQR
jgi:predicted aspartyl protease